MTGPSEVQHLLKIISQAATDALNEYARHGEEVPSIYETKSHPLDIAETAFTLKKAIRTLEGACNQLCSTLAPPLHTVINNAVDHYWSCSRIGAQKGFADILYGHQGGLHIIEVLLQRLGINQGKLATIIMWTLASRHCFHEVAKDVYANNRLSLALRSQTPGAAFLDLQTGEGQQAAFYFQRYLDDPTYGPSTDLKHTAFTYSISVTIMHIDCIGDTPGNTSLQYIAKPESSEENLDGPSVPQSSTKAKGKRNAEPAETEEEEPAPQIYKKRKTTSGPTAEGSGNGRR
ncbi:hypothetical protein DFJ43DRAFT_1164016 [Lentinula guzmanii]|uniref:Uncharacterized protein n=1 Tax=Lentinula guzmanii TaxID=2804957 RepID=A0AA38N612_9AGAR|nr:hypothetical protein DFJ43DRAFT_1164016 [Lentinula guzmanii]